METGTKHNWQVITSLVLENSYGVITKQDDVLLDVTIGIKDDDYGYFELYDIASGGDHWYAEGGLWFDGKVLTDYDGVFELLPCITQKLNELGYITDQI